MKRTVLGVALGLVVAVVVAVVAYCRKPDEFPTDPNLVVSSVDSQALVEANNRFAIDLYRAIAAKEAGNFAVSPYSISASLTLAWAGAKNATAGEMADVLHIAGLRSDIHAAHAKIRPAPTAGSPVRFARALWCQKGAGLEPGFVGLARTRYAARVEALDFRGDPAGATAAIDGWVRRQTGGRIDRLLRPEDLTAATRIVLTDAVLFRDVWANPFPASRTGAEPFFVSPDLTRTAKMMNATFGASCLSADDAKIARLYYRGNSVSMLAVVPDDETGLAKVEAGLSADRLRDWRTGLRAASLTLSLPRFATRFRSDLRPALTGMGMKAAFGAEADFTGIVGRESPFLSAVVHETAIEVDEEGTVAAAATAVVGAKSIAKKEPPQVTIRADRPFLYLIVDEATGMILFIGRLVDPG